MQLQLSLRLRLLPLVILFLLLVRSKSENEPCAATSRAEADKTLADSAVHRRWPRKSEREREGGREREGDGGPIGRFTYILYGPLCTSQVSQVPSQNQSPRIDLLIQQPTLSYACLPVY